jgi:type IV pilus assembly protein PilE
MHGFNRFRSQGFTLIELMIVVLIIAILAAIAMPSYQNYVMKSRRSDAKVALVAIQLAEEKWRANNTSYTSTLSNLGLTSSSPAGYYTLSVALTNGYTITALATGVQASDTGCAQLILNQAGNKTANNSAGTAVTNCW